MTENPILWLLITVIDFFTFFVIASVVMSWLLAFEVLSMRNRYVYLASDVLFRVTEPALRRIRQYMPNLGNLDLSPLVLIVLLYFSKLSVYWVYVNLIQ